jgi:hypothetical protein
MTTVAAITAFSLSTTPLQAQQRIELPARDRVLSGTAGVIYSVGREEGEDHELFGNVTAVGFDDRDQLYVLDSGGQRIVGFDARGGHVRTIGRRGSGPGEFAAAVAMAVAGDGSVLVADLGRAALSLFTPDGEHRSIALPTTIGRPTPGALMRDARGGAAFRTMNFSREALMSGAATTSPLVRLAPLADGATATTLFEFPQPAPDVRNDGQGRTMVMITQQAFAPQPLWVLHADGGAAVAFGTGYRIQQVDAQGRVRRVIERPIQPRRVTRDDREREVQRRADAAAAGGTGTRVTVTPGGTSMAAGAMPGGGRPASAADIAFAEIMPVLSRMSVDPAGRLWVQRTAARVGEDGPIDIIGSDGQYIGTLPAQRMPAAFSTSGRAAYIVTDDLGVQRVIVRSLPQTWRW